MTTPPTEERKMAEVWLDGRLLARCSSVVIVSGDGMLTNERGEMKFTEGLSRAELYSAQFQSSSHWVENLCAEDALVTAVLSIGGHARSGRVRVLHVSREDDALVVVQLAGKEFTMVITIAAIDRGRRR